MYEFGGVEEEGRVDVIGLHGSAVVTDVRGSLKVEWIVGVVNSSVVTVRLIVWLENGQVVMVREERESESMSSSRRSWFVNTI